jgi:hypothetical protein
VLLQLCCEKCFLFLLSRHVEEILTVGLDFVLHVVDDLFSHPLFSFSLVSGGFLLVLAGTGLDDLPFEGALLEFLALEMMGQVLL